ncbi:hypothetical protein HID58_069854 [Brassica napus]|uniref:Uncharacterized protein n=1 Tax=Brassica napus TaxID=3708 RepID=A0ABQ7YX35_BRANA|nr:hypothetical protein HID58_069854 [Brassica napus]
MTRAVLLSEYSRAAASCHTSVSEVLVADSDTSEYSLAEPWAKLVVFVRIHPCVLTIRTTSFPVTTNNCRLRVKEGYYLSISKKVCLVFSCASLF